MRCLSVLDLVFFILFVLFFFLGREAQKVREWGVNSLKNVNFFPLPTPLRGCRVTFGDSFFVRTV